MRQPTTARQPPSAARMPRAGAMQPVAPVTAGDTDVSAQYEPPPPPGPSSVSADRPRRITQSYRPELARPILPAYGPSYPGIRPRRPDMQFLPAGVQPPTLTWEPRGPGLSWGPRVPGWSWMPGQPVQVVVLPAADQSVPPLVRPESDTVSSETVDYPVTGASVPMMATDPGAELPGVVSDAPEAQAPPGATMIMADVTALPAAQPEPTAPSWWSERSQGEKAAVVGGSLLALLAGAYYLLRSVPKATPNRRRQAKANASKRYVVMTRSSWGDQWSETGLASGSKASAVSKAVDLASRNPARRYSVLDRKTGRVVFSHGPYDANCGR